MNRFAAMVTSAAVALGLLLVACVALLPGWIVGDAALPVTDRLRVENDVRATLLQGVAGLLALAGLALGASVTMRQVRVNREGQFIDLFTKAVRLRPAAGALAAGPRGGAAALARCSPTRCSPTRGAPRRRGRCDGGAHSRAAAASTPRRPIPKVKKPPARCRSGGRPFD